MDLKTKINEILKASNPEDIIFFEDDLISLLHKSWEESWEKEDYYTIFQIKIENYLAEQDSELFYFLLHYECGKIINKYYSKNKERIDELIDYRLLVKG